MKSLRLLFLLFLLAVPLLAHDTWLIPSALRTTPGTTVDVRLATSEAFPTSEVAASPDRIARFVLRQPSGTQPVEGYRVDGTFLVARVTPTEPGHSVVIAETKPRAFVLEPKIFNQYLQEEQLTAILQARAAGNQTSSPGRERYQKIAKTILCVGAVNDSLHTLPNDLWLEIIPERDPCSLRVGDSLPVQVLYQGRPLAGVHAAAGYAAVTGHKYPVWVLTDSAGRATLPLDRSGLWFARVLHMVPAAGDAEADWRSAFSTLTFEVAPVQAAASDPQSALRSLLQTQVDTWNRGDIEGFMEGYWKSGETALVSSSGVSRGWQALLDRYRRSYPDGAAMGQLQFSDLEITPLGPDAALILGRWQLVREKDRPGGVFTLIARRFPDGWRIIHDHTSSVPPPSP